MDLPPLYRCLLVPLDGSPPSQHALQEAIALARGLGARLRLMHVLDARLLLVQALSGEPPERLIDRQAEDGAHLLDEAAACAREAGVEVETVLRENPPSRVSDQIVAEARDGAADLIVMGTHGRHGLAERVLGSNAETVLRSSHVPVLVVRGD